MEFHGIKVVIWDLDGALVHTQPDLIESFRVSARQIGYGELTEEQVSGKIGGGAKRAFERMFGEGNDELVAKAMEFFASYYPEHCAEKSTLYPGIREVLQELSSSVKFALVTAKIRSASLNILTKLGIDDFFSFVVSADEMTKMKPDPQGIQMVIDHFQVQPNEVVMIGDMKTDVMAAQSAGAHSIAVSYGYGNLADLIQSSPDVLVDKAEDIIKSITWSF